MRNGTYIQFQSYFSLHTGKNNVGSREASVSDVHDATAAAASNHEGSPDVPEDVEKSPTFIKGPPTKKKKQLGVSTRQNRRK